MPQHDVSCVDERPHRAFEALQWHQRRSPAGTRVIVWTASVPAARQSARTAGAKPLGECVQAHYGNQATSIGLVASSGAVGPRGGRGQPTPIAQAITDSLESRALSAMQACAISIARGCDQALIKNLSASD